MKPILALVITGLCSVPAWAHFIWLVPDGNRSTPTVLMVFSDDFSPDERVPIKKIAHIKLFARAGDKGEAVTVQMTEDKSAFRLTHEGEGVVMIAGTCRYGVVAKGKATPFLLNYYPKTLLRKGIVSARAAWTLQPTDKLPLEIVTLDKQPSARVFWHGKPLAGAEVVLKVPGLDKDVERKTDSDGVFQMEEPKAGGIYGMRASYIEPKQGELDGKKYEEVKHYATLTFQIPEGFAK